MHVNSRSRLFTLSLTVLSLLLITVVGFNFLGRAITLPLSLYYQTIGSLLGGIIVVVSVNIPIRPGEEVEPWLGRERIAWTLIGAGIICWGVGQAAYVYEYSNGLVDFPAVSDIGYTLLPPLVFAGLLLQPASDTERVRLKVSLDSLISMGAMLSIAWFLLLGSLAQTPGQDPLAKFLGLYYPVTDMALLSCVVFLILRGQKRVYEAPARRLGLVLFGVGIVIFAVSDFNYNVQNNLGTYVDGSLLDLGWPLGLLMIGVAAHLRRFVLSPSSDVVEERVRQRDPQSNLGIARFLPYILLGTLMLVLVINVLSQDAIQVKNRPVLLFATIAVVVLVIVRLLITQLENEILSRRQNIALKELAIANGRVKEQARTIAGHNADLEEGIAHLKEVQAQIANGNMHARARISSGNLVPLAGSLNLMAERLLRFDQVESYMQKLTHALGELSHALEVYRTSSSFILPPNCKEIPEIHRLLLSMGMKQSSAGIRFAVQPFAIRSSENALSGSTTAHPASSPQTNRSSGSVQSKQPNGPAQPNRPTRSPLASSDLRGKASLRPPGPRSPGERSSTASSDLGQREFPSPPSWE